MLPRFLNRISDSYHVSLYASVSTLRRTVLPLKLQFDTLKSLANSIFHWSDGIMSSNSISSDEHTLQTPLVIVCIFIVMLVIRSVLPCLLCGIDRTSSPGNLQHSNPDQHHSLQFQGHGLELCVVPSAPMSQFKKEGEGEEKPMNTECAICLGEFEGEWVKKLPNCNHVFHDSCVDKWFLPHSNCPPCRSNIYCLS